LEIASPHCKLHTINQSISQSVSHSHAFDKLAKSQVPDNLSLERHKSHVCVCGLVSNNLSKTNNEITVCKMDKIFYMTTNYTFKRC